MTYKENITAILECYFSGFKKEIIDSACDCILEQEPKTECWIPVNKRLPYNHEYIQNNGLFNVSDGNRSYSAWFDIYDTEKFGEPTMSGFRVDHAVTAWMPLPKPYKAESEDKS